MLPIAGQTAGPNMLKFFEDTYGWPGVFWAKKNKKTFFLELKKKFHGQRARDCVLKHIINCNIIETLQGLCT